MLSKTILGMQQQEQQYQREQLASQPQSNTVYNGNSGQTVYNGNSGQNNSG